MSGKLTLSFEKAPALIFVQEDLRNWYVVQDGKEIRGIRNITIEADAEGITTHEIEYLTGATSEGEEN